MNSVDLATNYLNKQADSGWGDIGTGVGLGLMGSGARNMASGMVEGLTPAVVAKSGKGRAALLGAAALSLGGLGALGSGIYFGGRGLHKMYEGEQKQASLNDALIKEAISAQYIADAASRFAQKSPLPAADKWQKLMGLTERMKQTQHGPIYDKGFHGIYTSELGRLKGLAANEKRLGHSVSSDEAMAVSGLAQRLRLGANEGRLKSGDTLPSHLAQLQAKAKRNVLNPVDIEMPNVAEIQAKTNAYMKSPEAAKLSTLDLMRYFHLI